MIRQCCPQQRAIDQCTKSQYACHIAQDARGREEKWRVFVVTEKSEVGPFSEKQVEKVPIMHTDACYVPRAQDSQERYRVLFVPVANVAHVQHILLTLTDAIERQENGKNFSASIETCAPYDVLISLYSISFLTSFYEFEFFKSYLTAIYINKKKST